MHLLLLDSASLYWRAYHALPDSIVGPAGQPVNAIRGFLDTVARLIEAREPDRVVACWDDDWRPQWRVDLVPGYKAHRLDTIDGSSTGAGDDAEVVPDTLAPQVPWIARLSTLLGIDVIGAPECEADDVIAALARRHVRTGDTVDIASGDRDLVQLVDERTTMLYTGGTSKSRGGKPWVALDPEGVRERFLVAPDSYPLMAVLRGDPSDGLPGVRGIGAKTAVALVHAFPDVQALIDAAAHPCRPPMTGRIAAAIVENEEVIKASMAITVLGDRPAVPDLPPWPSIEADQVREVGDDLGVIASVDRVLAAWGHEPRGM